MYWEKMKDKLKSIFSDIRTLNNIKFLIFSILLMVYAYIMQLISSLSAELYILSGVLILIFLMGIYKLVDILFMKIVLKDIDTNNKNNLRRMGNITYGLNKIDSISKELAKAGSKYEMYWNMLRKAVETSGNTGLGECMDKIEDIVDPMVEKEFDK